MDVLGIHAFQGPSSAALVRDGRVLAAAREELFTRHGNDSSFPRNAIAFCLRSGKIGPGNLDAIAWCGRSRLDVGRSIADALRGGPRAYTEIGRTLMRQGKSALEIPRLLAKELDGKVPRHDVDEFLAEVAGCLMGTSVTDAVVVGLTFDERGRETFAAALVTPQGIERVDSFGRPTGTPSPGSAAPNATATPAAAAPEQVARAAMHRFPGRPLIFVGPGAAQVFGAARRAGASQAAATASTSAVPPASLVAAERSSGSPFWTHPAAGRGAAAAGAALLVSRTLGLQAARAAADLTPTSPWALGPGYNSHQIRTYLRSREISVDEMEPEALWPRLAESLSLGKTVAVFSGRLDLGGNPFGSRGIFAVEKTSTEEVWADLHLDGTTPTRGGASGEDRVAVDRAERRSAFDLLTAYGQRVGNDRPSLAVRALSLTGDPLACTPHDAFECFLRMKIDEIALGPYLVTRSQVRHVTAGVGSTGVFAATP